MNRRKVNGKGAPEVEGPLNGQDDEPCESKGEADLYKWADDNGVFMINVITVPKAESDEFQRRWDRITDYMRRQPGFIRTNLSRRM